MKTNECPQCATEFEGHTPGPWFARQDPHTPWGDDWMIGREDGRPDEVAVCGKKDAALIAAAPALLAENATLKADRDRLYDFSAQMDEFLRERPKVAYNPAEPLSNAQFTTMMFELAEHPHTQDAMEAILDGDELRGCAILKPLMLEILRSVA